ncbi:MAG: response regulator [Betaproteobacteria bacterium]|nr:response regulator [Betaproteobacteria bacterium]
MDADLSRRARVETAVTGRQGPKHDHLVQFYESETFLIDSICGFVSSALGAGHGAIVVATGSHKGSIRRQLRGLGHDIEAAVKRGQYLEMDAATVLAQFMVDREPDRQRFFDVVGGLIKQVAARYPTVQIFGEMVALLWADGDEQAAIRLEQMWNELAKMHAFTLYCAYPINGFSRHCQSGAFLDVCAEHSRVVPAESELRETDFDQHFRKVAELQQKTIALVTEIEDHKKTQAALKRRERQRVEADARTDEFLAMLGHELRNPLSPILSALEVLREAGGDVQVAETAHTAIGHQTRHLARIVDDLLDVSRVNSGKIHLRNELIELAPVLERAVAEMRPLIDAKRHRFSVFLPAEKIMVTGDSTRLQQIFSNLLNNAAKFMDPDGEISLRAQVAGNNVNICVQDSGIGIEAKQHKRIFKMFAQGDRSLDRSLGGLGVGLWMTRSLVELHGGTIQVCSSGVDKGSRFTVSLPLTGIEAPAPVAESSDANRDLHACRVLVIDDNRDGADLLALLLRMQGHVVKTANDGITGLEIAATFDPDVVLLDIGLPGLNGYAVARQLRQRDSARRQCLIAMTGYGTDEDRERTREAGFDHHIVKPVEPDELNELVAGAARTMRA